MPKFLLRGSYTAAGVQGSVKEGFASRQRYITSLIEGLGGSAESLYWAYGNDDVILILDAPDASIAVAASLAINQSGAVQLTTTPLLTAAEMDAAVAKLPAYRPPGG